MIYYVPIEPLPERYTESWYRNFPKELQTLEKVTVIDGEPLSDHVGVGTFLDINSTVAYKSSQLRQIAKLFHSKSVQPESIFFIADIEFWGIESLRLMSQMNGVPIYIAGFLHAGSYTREDAFEIAAPYQRFTEVGWFQACDVVFVGSEYHKKAFIERRLLSAGITSVNKLVVTGNPLFEEDYKGFPRQDKEPRVILPNRFDWEKRPNLSLDFAYLLKRRLPDVQIVITTSRPKFKSNQSWLVELARNMEKDGILTIREGLSKEEYHMELARSSVMLSNSIEENFGYCIAEAMMYNCFPLVPTGLSHDELVDDTPDFLFSSNDEVLDKLEALLFMNMSSLTDPKARHLRKMCQDRAQWYCQYPIRHIKDALSGLRCED